MILNKYKTFKSAVKVYLKNALPFQAKCGVHLDMSLRDGTQN